MMLSPYGSIVLKALIQALSLFRLLRILLATGCTLTLIRGGVVLLLIVSVQSCLDPGLLLNISHIIMATKSIVQGW